MIDIARFMEAQGHTIDHVAGQAIPIEVVEKARAAQGVDIEPGDIVLLRFGWLQYYRDVASPETRASLVKDQR
ncbi:UNVERIFIED_CONTAM: cyclase family protein, partial [Bacteroidetes bacterium 56_B9]